MFLIPNEGVETIIVKFPLVRDFSDILGCKEVVVDERLIFIGVLSNGLIIGSAGILDEIIQPSILDKVLIAYESNVAYSIVLL